MEATNSHLIIVQGKYPVHNNIIQTLYDRNADFRTLCEDYYLCLESTQKIRRDIEEREDRLYQYETLMRQLEKDLLDFINKYLEGRLNDV